ncbi:MAG: amidohydrolase [Chloroflexota bacterium]
MPQAELVLKNVRVITMDHRRPYAVALAVRGDRVLMAGGVAEAASVTGPRTRVLDLGGGTVVPGFNDAHGHLFSFIRQLLGIDLSPEAVSSIEDIKAAVLRKARQTPTGEWLSGSGYNEYYLAERRCPNRWDLDPVSPEHPVILNHRGLHACVLNSRALALVGIGISTPDPPGGLIERDIGTGEPTGVLYEILGYLRERVLPPLSTAQLDEGVRRASEHFLARGITSFQDATVNNDYRRWEILRGFKTSGSLQSRVSMMFGAKALRRFEDAGMVTGRGDAQLRLGGVKLMLGETTGALQPDRETLHGLALSCHRAGFQLAFHAIQESTVAAALGALEFVGSRGRLFGRRHRIEHCAECPPELLARLSKLPVAVVTQPPFIYYSGERYLATVPRAQQPWLYRVGSISRSGIPVAGSSDLPVVPADPLVGIYAAVTRATASGQKLLPEEALTVPEALALYTTKAAYVSFEEDIKGSLAPGMLADMAVLSADPTRVPPEAIKDIRVVMTIIGGKVVWEA